MVFKKKYWLKILWLMIALVFADLGFERSVSAQEVSPERESPGIDVSGLPDVESIGFLSRKNVEAWGHIFSSETEKTVLCEGDIVIISVEKGYNIKQDDLFTVYNQSALLKNPLCGKKLGHTISILGRIVIKDQVKYQLKEHLFIGEIVESYRGMKVGDPIFPYKSISPCIQPVPFSCKIATNIVAVKDQHELIGQFSVVYLAHGYNYGIRKGNLFEVVRETLGLPDEVLGHVLVLETRPDTATCIVVDSKKEFPNGTHIKSISWAKAQNILSIIPECRF